MSRPSLRSRLRARAARRSFQTALDHAVTPESQHELITLHTAHLSR